MTTKYRFGWAEDSAPDGYGAAAALPASMPATNYASGQAGSNPDRGFQWYLNGAANGASNGAGANVDAISAEYTGRGIVVGIIDEGFDSTNPDLTGRFDLTLSFDPRDHGVTNIMPDSPAALHGTWVAGVLGASGDNDFGIVGVAPDATLAGFYARYGLGGSTRAELADLLARQVNVDVSNNSWGYTKEFSDNFQDPSWAAVGNALHNGAGEGRDGLGTVYVFAAGNDRQYIANTLAYDGDNTNYHGLTNSRFVITVAASTEDGHIAPFSTPGASILVTAPGESIMTTALNDGVKDPANDFAFVNGTSFAAPIVSGVVAMMLEANPDLGYRDVQEILALSAHKIDPASSSWAANGATNWNGGANLASNDFGFGLVDAHAAVRLAETWTTTHTADSESMIAVAGHVEGNTALVDFHPVAYTISVPASAQGFSIDWIEVDVSLLHSHIGDLKIDLISPTGTDSVLMDRPGAGTNAHADLSFTFSTDHDWGESPVGTWSLVVEDAGTGGTGSMVSYALRFYGDHEGNDTTYYYTDDFASLSGDRGTITDGAGSDTISAAAVTSDLILDLHPGAVSTIAGRAITISPDTVIENAYGGDGSDVITGNDAGNHLDGGHGNDTIFGGRGDDTIDGGKGADLMAGGAGNDTYLVDDARDVATENPNAGVDTVAASVSYTLGADVENLTLTGALDLNGTGNALDNVIVSNSGIDTLTGGDGNDIYYVHNALDRVVEMPGGGIDTVYADVDFTPSDNVENLILTGVANLAGTGNSLDNVITSNMGVNTLAGGDGNDTYFVNNAQDHVVEAAGGGLDTVYADVSFALPDNVESLILSGKAGLDGTGNGLDNAITGNAGGNTLDGGVGADTLAGGAGNDTYVVDNADDRVIEQAHEGIDTVLSSVGHTLSANVENLTLTGLDNINGTGNELDNVIISNTGVDTLAGGDGNDIYLVHNSLDHVVETLNGGNDTVYADVNFVLPVNVETLILVGQGDVHGMSDALGGTQGLDLNADSLASAIAADINGFGNELDNTLVGTAGVNLLDGGQGADLMIGRAGNDIYVVDNTADTITEYQNEGIDTVFADVNLTLGANVENAIVWGTDTVSVTGNDLNNLIIGNDAGDTINGGAGIDPVLGGAGNDLIIGGTGMNWLYGLGGNDLLQGGSDADVVFGGDGDDVLDGGAGINWLDGGNGNDRLLGGSGSDSMFGQAGDDYLDGAAGDDGLLGGAGNDILIGGAGNDWMSGGEGNDILVGGTGTDVLVGSDGDDRIVGGADRDFLVGGAGADTFVFNAPAEGGDFIWDFERGIDAIELNRAGYGLPASGPADLTFAEGNGLPADFATDAPVAYVDHEINVLWFDPTGGSSVDAVLVAGFISGLPTASDIHLL